MRVRTTRLSAMGSVGVAGPYVPPIPSAPVNTVAPSISGSAIVYQTLTASDGAWTGFPAPSFAYQWRRNGANIGGATAQTYTLQEADHTATITVSVTATNSQGSASAVSDGVVIAAAAPVNAVAPVASGSTGLGDVLSTTNGTWTGFPAPAFAYQWTRNGVDIAGATGSTYPVAVADSGASIACRVTATNAGGSVAQASNSITAQTFTAPLIASAPTISGTAEVGQVLTATPSGVSGNPAPTRTWQWLRDGASISGATSSTYTLVSADGGTDISVRQTETNALGFDAEVSAVVEIPVSASFDPATLFGASDQGAVYDFTDESLLFQDLARTIPVTSPGQPLFSALDISGKGNHINQNRGTPRWQGEPATWGPNLLASPLMESAGDWTAGAGWSVSGGLATKTAGTASPLSQTVTVAAGRVYMAQFRVVTRTAGNVFVRLNGTTVVSHFTGYNAAGEYLELLTAVTGNNTFEIWGDATFAGTINTAGLYEVTSFYDMGVCADFNERLITGNINMSASNAMTVIVASKRARRQQIMYAAQIASTATGVGGNGEIVSRTNSPGFIGTDGVVSDTATEGDPNLSLSSNYGIYAVRRDTNQAAISDQHRVQFNGVDIGQTNSGGPFASPTANSATAKISLLAWINTSSMFAGSIHRVVVINRVLTDEELAAAVNWCGFDGKFSVGACTGDSTWEKDSASAGVGRGLTSNTTDFIGPFAGMLAIENWGDDTLEQNADWSALTSTNLSKLNDVQVAVGLNDIAGRVDSGATVPQILADLQSYINEIRADCPTARLIGFQLPPCRAWLEGRANAANCIAAREAWNAALVNGTITGLDAVATQHVAQMDDGSGYLRPILNTGASGARDGVHPGELGRLIMGVSARQARVSIGTMQPARTFP